MRPQPGKPPFRGLWGGTSNPHRRTPAATCSFYKFHFFHGGSSGVDVTMTQPHVEKAWVYENEDRRKSYHCPYWGCTWPPMASIRCRSSGRSGLWSSDSATAHTCPFTIVPRTHLESPRLATDIFETRAGTAGTEGLVFSEVKIAPTQLFQTREIC